MSRLPVFSFAATAVALLAAIPAQTSNHLVGLTRVGSDLRHQSHAACAQLAICSPAGFPSGAGQPPSAGGTAWDSRRSGAWISEGNFLALVDDNCAYICPPFVAPIPAANYIVGLEVVEKLDQLWAIDNTGLLHRFALTSCPPAPLAPCAVGFVNPFVTTGLAVDELSGIVFYGRTDPVTGANFVVTAPEALPCAPVQLLPVPPCAVAMGPWTGLAVDAGARVIYATDSLRTVGIAYQVIGAAVIAVTGMNCCPPVAAGADPLVGLAVRPGRATATGASCTNGTCAACPMNHGTVGDSVLGNNDFALRLANAPAGSLAWCFVGAGPCWLPGAAVPPLCGAVHLPGVLGTLGANFVPGAAGCGTTDFALPLPSSSVLAGAVMSSQCLVFCPAGVGGFGLSHCLSFELQGL